MLKAPADGSVTDLEIAQGDYINDPTATAMTISNLDTVWVTANVSEKDLKFTFNGQAVNVAFPGLSGPELQRQGPAQGDVLSPTRAAIAVRIAFDNPEQDIQAQHVRQRDVRGACGIETRGADLCAADEQRQHQRLRRGRPLGVRASEYRGGLSGGRRRCSSVQAPQPGERVVVKGGVRLND